MNIDKVLNNKRLCYAVIGINKQQFEILLTTFTQVWYEHLDRKGRKRKVGGGSNGNIKDPRKKLFFILWYAKVYPTYDVAAYVFLSSKSRTQNWGKTLMPLLEKALGRKVVLPVRRISSEEEFLSLFPGVQEILLDGVERPTVRRKKSKIQKKEYSGKKKRHTRKNTIITNTQKRILYLSPTKNGKVHDKKSVDKTNIIPRIPSTITIIADNGFQGLQHTHPNILMPKKRTKCKPLSQLDKEMNRLISSIRIGVEHAIGGMKRFGIAAHIFRGRLGQDDMFMNVSAGLYNLRLEYK